MSAYDSVVGGRLKLKGKALDVKSSRIKKKKKQHKEYIQVSEIEEVNKLEGGSTDLVVVNANEEEEEEEEEGDKWNGEGKVGHIDDLLTPAEKRYIEQRAKLDVDKLAKTAKKSHRDRIQDFNQYLANMSEHYDIPKVGPG